MRNSVNIDSWIDSNIGRLSSSLPDFRGKSPAQLFHSSHLDEIDDLLRGRQITPERAIDYLMHARSKVDVYDSGIRVALAIPLVGCARLDVVLPELNHLPVRSSEPPSLYLFSGAYYLSVIDTWERFSRGYEENPWGAELSVVYSCARLDDHNNSPKEYSRTVWIHPAVEI